MSKQTNTWIAKAVFYFVATGLFVYAMSRSLDFIMSTLPPSQQVVGYLGLLATGGGSISWLIVYLHHAKGTGQKGLSIVMVVLDLLGEGMLFTYDTLYRSAQSGMVATLPQEQVQMVIIILSALVFANIAATVGFHLLDPETSKRIREKSAKDALDEAVLKTIEDRAEQIAGEIAPKVVSEWEEDFSKRFSNMHALGLGNLAAKDQKDTIAGEPTSQKKEEAAEPLDIPYPIESVVTAGDMVEAAKKNGNGHQPHSF